MEQDLQNGIWPMVSAVGALSSGTAAIHLGLVLLGVQAGYCLVCSMTFQLQQPYIIISGASIFIDSELDTYLEFMSTCIRKSYYKIKECKGIEQLISSCSFVWCAL
jgi:hypothetical protein